MVLWCHVRHINPVKIHSERVTLEDKKLVNDLDYDRVEFPVQEKDFNKIEKRIIFPLTCFVMKISWVFQFTFKIKNLKNSMDLLLIIDENKSHYVYIKGFDRFMFHKTKNRNRKYLCKSCLLCFSSKNVLTKHKEVCLSINGAQSVRLKRWTNELKNYFKQIPVPFKVYADFECNLKSVESYEGSYSKKYQDHVPCSFAYKSVCVDDKFTKPIDVFKSENAAYRFIEKTLKGFEYCKKVMKKLTKICSWVNHKKNNFNRVTFAGYVKNLLMITMKK